MSAASPRCTTPRETASFIATTRSYLRGLSIDPAAKAELLGVFRAFRQLFNAYQTAQTARPAEPTMTYVPNSGTWRT